MKKVIAVILIAIIAIFGCAQAVSAYSIDLESQTPTEVTSGETFTLTVSLDENTPLANGHINYDTKLFEFVKASQNNMSAQAYTEEGYVSWMYTDTGSTGVKSYTFTFKAKDVSKTSTGTFSLSDAVFIAESEETYEGETINGKSKVDVTINVKENVEDTSNNNNNNNTSNVDKEQGKKDKTITSDSKLPKTGKGIIAYILIAIILLTIVCKFKYKKINKLFTLLVLPLIISMVMCNTNVLALKLADTEKYQVGLFDTLVKGEKIVAINPGKSYYQTESLSLEMLQSVFSEENLTIDNIINKEGNSITEKIATGDKVILTDNSEYTVLLYGDTNGDGTICNASDVSIVRNEYVKGERADDVYRLAADLSPDNILNVKDVAIIVKKYTAKTNGPLVSTFPDDDYELPKQTIKDEDVLTISSVETTTNTATVNLELNTAGLTANSITYEIYKTTDEEENILTSTYKTQNFTDLSHVFETLEENTEYYVIVILDCDEADYYAEKTITTLTSTTEPGKSDDPVMPSEPSHRVFQAELVVSNIKVDSADMEIKLVEGTELEESDSIFFGTKIGTYGNAEECDDLTFTAKNLKQATNYTFYAIISDADGNTVWRQDVAETTKSIKFDLTATKSKEKPTTNIVAEISNVNEDDFEFEKINVEVREDNKDGSTTQVLNKDIEYLNKNIEIDGLTPRATYNLIITIYDEAGNCLTKSVDEIVLDEKTQEDPVLPADPDDPVTPGEEITEYTATLEVDPITVTTSSLLVTLNITPNLDNYSVKYYVNGTQSYESTESYYTFKNLKAGETYEFWAEVFNESGEKVAVTCKVSHLIPKPDFTMSVIANEENPESSILVSATPYLDICSIEKYDMWISKLNEDDSTFTEIKAIENVPNDGGAFEDFEIKGLDSNTKYIVTVRATDNGGNTVIKTVNITTAEAPRELEGYLEVTNNFEGTVSVKINITEGNINSETDIICFRNSTMEPKEWNQTTGLTYTYTELPTNGMEITFLAQIKDCETGLTYAIEKVTANPMSVEPVTIKETTTNAIAIEGKLPNNLTNERVVYKIADDNGYKDEYGTNLKEINSLSFEYKFIGLEENTNYNVWFEIYGENGNLLADSEKVQAKTSRELEIDLELVSTNKRSAKTTLTATKGKFLSGDYMKLYMGGVEMPGQMPHDVLSDGKVVDGLVFNDLTANEVVKLSVIVYDENNTKLAEDSINVLIRDVEIKEFYIQNMFAKEIQQATAHSEAEGILDTDNIVYEVRQNNNDSKSYDGEIGTYTYTNLIPGEKYYFKLKVYDETWNLLAVSEEIEYTVPMPEISLTLENTETNPSTKINAKVEVIAQEETIGFTPNEYNYYVYKVNDDNSTTEVKRNLRTTRNEWNVTDLLPSTTYQIVVTATDKNNKTSATTEKIITTADAIDTIIIRPTDGRVIGNYDPTPGSALQYKNGGFSNIDIINCDDENLLDLPVTGTLEIEVKNATIISSAYNESLEHIEGASYTKENEKVIITLEEVTLSKLKNQPIALTVDDYLTEDDKVSITTTTNLTLNGREDITFVGQTIELPIVYRVDETPEISIENTYEDYKDEVTVEVIVENLAKIDTYYFKLYKYGYNNELKPVEGSVGEWVESSEPTYTFENLEANTTYLVVATAKSIQGNHAEEVSFEFTTDSIKPHINEEHTATAGRIESTIIDEGNIVKIKNYQRALVDTDENHNENGKAKYISMPISENTTNPYTFNGLYPNTKYIIYSQATSVDDVMSNYINSEATTELIRDTLNVESQMTTDSISVSINPLNLMACCLRIESIGIYNIEQENCTIKYMYKEVGTDSEILHTELTDVKNSDNFRHKYDGLVSGKEYEFWAEIYDKFGKQIWTTKQLVIDPITGEETGEESGEIIELEALQIASIEANRRQETSLDIKVILDEESLERLANNANTNYTYNVEVYTAASIENSTNSEDPIVKKQFAKGGEYKDIIGEYSINFADGKYYTEYDEETEEYLGDIFHIEGLNPETNYRVVVTVSDANGGTSEITDINKKDIKTRAAVPEIYVDYKYEQVAYESDAMDAVRLNRVATATISVTNDAVIDYEYLNTSGFNFKLYKGETVNSEELINPTQQAIRYYYNEYDEYDEMTKLEKDLAREQTADSNEQLQKWKYTISDLAVDQSYLWNVKATSRVGKESEISSHIFTAVWQTPELVIDIYQDTATSFNLQIYNDINDEMIPKVKRYNINVVEIADNGIERDTNGNITNFTWVEGEAIYSESITEFPSEDFWTGGFFEGKQAIGRDITGLKTDTEYVVIIEAEAENGTTRTYYELIDTTAIARVFRMGNSSYYPTLQSAVNAAPSQSNVILMKDTTETVTFENETREGIILTSENEAKLVATEDANSLIRVTKEQGVTLQDIEIEGYIYVGLMGSGEQPILNILNDVKVISNSEALIVYNGTANIAGKNIGFFGKIRGIYNINGTVNIRTVATENDSESIEIISYTGTSNTSGIRNNGILTIKSNNTKETTNKELFIQGWQGIYNTGTVTINSKNIDIIGSEYGIYNDKGKVIIEDGENISVKAIYGIYNVGSSNNNTINGTIDVNNVRNFRILGRTGISNETGVINITNELSNNKVKIQGDSTYGISNKNNAILNITGKNIEIVGVTAGIANGFDDATATCEISTITTEGADEAIQISGTNTGINNFGKLTMNCTKTGENAELIISNLSMHAGGTVSDMGDYIYSGTLVIGSGT